MLEIVLSHLSSMVESCSSSLWLMHGQIVSRGNSTGLGHINILLDLSSTRDYRMLLCMIGMIEKMLGLWGTNSFFPLLMWEVLGLWLSCSKILWLFADTSTNQISFLLWLLIQSGQKSFTVSSLARQLATDHPDIVSWVFEQKKKALLKLIDNSFFGTTVAYIYTIEFQKRGFPYIHLLIFLHPQHHIRDSYYINSIISA